MLLLLIYDLLTENLNNKTAYRKRKVTIVIFMTYINGHINNI